MTRTLAQEAAPGIITKLKTAGVTSVIMFTDIAQGGAMTKVATQQEYSPEWVLTAYQYQDVALARPQRTTTRTSAPTRSGCRCSAPLIAGTAMATTLIDWYWGAGRATTESSPRTW